VRYRLCVHVTGRYSLVLPGWMNFDNPILGPVFAVMAGVLSSVNPCALSAIPIVVAHVAAVEKHRQRTHVFMFVLGMALALSFAGVVVGLVGKSLLFVAPWLRWVAGIAFLIAGLSYFGVFGISRTCEALIPSEAEETHQNPQDSSRCNSGDSANLVFRPLFMGMLYGLSSSPCTTPMLVAILSIAASSGSLMRGGMLLFGYSLGQSVFVILAGLFTSAFMGFLENEKGVLVVEVARKLSGIIIAGFGGYLLIRPYI